MLLDNIITTLDLAIHKRISEIDASKLKNSEVNVLNAFFIEKEKRPELVSVIQIPELMHDYLSLSLEERSELERLRVERPDYLKGRGDENNSRSINNKKIKSIAQKTRWTKQLITIFDFYLKDREEGEIFYFREHKQPIDKFRNLSQNIYLKASRNLQEEGGIWKIVELASQQRPELKQYTTVAGILKIDGPKQLIRMFDFYLENRKEGEVFNSYYIKNNKKLKKKFKNLGKNLCTQAYNNLRKKGGIQRIVELASKERPELKDYTTFKDVLKIDGPKQLIRMFDFYLKKHKNNERFNPNYLKKNKQLKKEFENIGKNLCHNVYMNLQEEGGIQRIVELASKERPEILEHWDYQERNKFNINQAVQDFIKFFDFYLKNGKESEIFNSGYITNKFGNLGRKLYDNAYNNLQEEGGIQRIVELASKERPEILEHWDYLNRFNTTKAVQDFLRMFDFYLEEHKESKAFNSNYLMRNKQLKKKFGTLGNKLCSGAIRNLRDEGGIRKVVELAAKERPEILSYWSYKEINKFDTKQTVQYLIKIFDFYLENRKKSQIFNSNYIKKNEQLKKEFGNLGRNLCENARNNFRKEGGMRKIVELAAQERPEILEHWSYQKQNHSQNDPR